MDLELLCTDRTLDDVDRLREVAARIDEVGLGGLSQEDRDFWRKGEGTPVRTLDGYLLNFRDGALRLKPLYIRGAYNHTDLNRVGAAAAELSGLLHEQGYTIPVQARTDRTVEDVPKEGEMEVYLDNVRRLSGRFGVPQGTPGLPGQMEKLDYNGANAIEAHLAGMYFLLDRVPEAWLFCGEPFCGEEF